MVSWSSLSKSALERHSSLDRVAPSVWHRLELLAPWHETKHRGQQDLPSAQRVIHPPSHAGQRNPDCIRYRQPEAGELFRRFNFQISSTRTCSIEVCAICSSPDCHSFPEACISDEIRSTPVDVLTNASLPHQHRSLCIGLPRWRVPRGTGTALGTVLLTV